MKEKGITIISLVVTIIILLILAGVTIGAVTGDNGLFRKAKDAVEESKKASYQEELTTIGLGIKLEKSSTPISNKEYVDLFEEEMNRQIAGNTIFKDSKIRRKNDETLRVETKEGYVYYVKENEVMYIGKAGEVDESEVPDITMGDINFNYSTEDWTNEDVTVEILIGDNIENKDNYVIEYSKDAKNWTRYTQAITMTANGEIYARAKDKFGDIKVEKYATGEVQNIDKNDPTPGTITMKMASSKASYTEGTEVYQNVEITVVDGQDNEGESGHKITTCAITGGRGEQSNQTGSIVLKASDNKYQVTVTTEDNAGNTSTSRAYILNPTYAKDNKSLTVSDGTFYVPEGFKLAEDSAETINEGIVVEDKNENQWVWVPCYVDGGVGSNVADAIKYDRRSFRDDDIENDYTEEPNSTDESSIRYFGGFYIGRYEAGDKESTESKEMRTAEKYQNNGKGDDTHTVTIKKGQAPYNYVILDQSVKLSNEIATSNNYNTNKMYTKLCSSYAWDTAVIFIGGDHIINPSQGNYIDTTFRYTDITGAIDQIKEENNSKLVPTGQTTAVKNIYDMRGNTWEYTLELCNVVGPWVLRGGDFLAQSEWTASIRGQDLSGAVEQYSFRSTLYLKQQRDCNNFV